MLKLIWQNYHWWKNLLFLCLYFVMLTCVSLLIDILGVATDCGVH